MLRPASYYANTQRVAENRLQARHVDAIQRLTAEPQRHQNDHGVPIRSSRATRVGTFGAGFFRHLSVLRLFHGNIIHTQVENVFDEN